MKIVSSFKLNPFPFDEADCLNSKNYGDAFATTQNQNSGEMDGFTNDDDELFNVFPPFIHNDTFQTNGQDESTSSGPIFSLLTRANQS